MKKKDEELESVLNKVIDLAEAFGLSELEIQEGKKRVRIKRPCMFEVISSEEKGKEELLTEQEGYEKITSPLGGIFYRASASNDPPYVEEGDIVEAGRTIALIEAMKAFNEIKAEFAAKVIKILVGNGKQIEAGETLFLVKPIMPAIE